MAVKAGKRSDVARLVTALLVGAAPTTRDAVFYWLRAGERVALPNGEGS